MSGQNAATTAVAGATPGEQEALTRLDAFGLTIAKLRREAIDGRRMLGIENEWLEDEEAYLGMDDANRAEFHATWRTIKPATAAAPFTTEAPSKATQGGATKSTALVNITRPYCDAATARIADMLLPNDDQCWAIEPTPLPDLVESAREDVMMTVQDATGTFEVSEKDFTQAIMDAATERAKKAERHIADWLVESNWKAEARAAIDDAGRIGTGILKGPIPKKRRCVSWSFENGVATKTVKYEHVPFTKRVDAWDFFPDPACGEDIQDGNHCFERDRITTRGLLNLKGTDGYIDAQIDACLKEGPIDAERDWTPSMQTIRTQNLRNERFEIWYFYGLVERSDLEAAGYTKLPSNGDYFHAIVTMVNHRVIKAALQALEDGTLPFDVMVWQKRPGMWCGIGVNRQMRVPQRQLTAAIRNLMDNAALSAGPQIVIDSTKIVPVNGVWEIVPRKLWKAKEGAELVEVDKAFRIVSIETRQAELMAIIELALRLAEQCTGMPLILQGQMPEQKVETLGQQQMLQNNASSVLRRLAKLWDDNVTSRHITRYYEYLMEYGTDDSEKGDYRIEARGSSTLVERDIQNQGIALLFNAAILSPEYNLDPKKTAEEYVRSQHLDPKRFQPDQATLEARAAEPVPPDPRVQAAAIQAETQAQNRQAQAIEGDKERAARMQEKLIDVNHDTELFNAEQQLKVKEGSGI